MKKLTRSGAPWLYPLPPVLVSCKHEDRANIITLAWAGVACSDPAIISLGIRPQRYSYGIIKESGEFVVNIPTASQVEQVDFCGQVSGRNVDKFVHCGFTPVPGRSVQAPLPDASTWAKPMPWCTGSTVITALGKHWGATGSG
ncbi:MAG TPA: flavin reductase family protein [Limnochordia bacterium]|nr:flavin reductase family protein [Limnochordia bacterium]